MGPGPMPTLQRDAAPQPPICIHSKEYSFPSVKSRSLACSGRELDLEEVLQLGSDLLIHPCPGLIKPQFCQLG